jgi:putative endonuclease
MPAPTTAHGTWNQLLGRKGEDAAARALADRGYRIEARNVRTSAGELDLIAERDGWTVLVEVKARRGRAHGLPEEAVTAAKKARLLAAAQCYLQERGLLDSPWRIDVIAVEFGADGRVLRCEVFENAVTG